MRKCAAAERVISNGIKEKQTKKKNRTAVQKVLHKQVEASLNILSVMRSPLETESEINKRQRRSLLAGVGVFSGGRRRNSSNEVGPSAGQDINSTSFPR